MHRKLDFSWLVGGTVDITERRFLLISFERHDSDGPDTNAAYDHDNYCPMVCMRCVGVKEAG
jgi:hypothetical protein